MSKQVANKVTVMGVVKSVGNYRVVGEKQTWERMSYDMDVKVSEDLSVKVKFDTNRFKYNSTEETSTYKGFGTIFDGVKTIEEDGEEGADKIYCNCRVINNSYYNKAGELVENIEYQVVNATRTPKKYEPIGSFETVNYIDKVTNNEDGTITVIGLVNEYKSANSIRGHYVEYLIADKDLIADLNGLLNEGDVSILEGYIEERKVRVEIPEKDLKELDTSRAVGRKKKELEAENERRRKLREEGMFKVSNVLVVDGGDFKLTPEDIEEKELPFAQDNIEDMEDNIDDMLTKLYDKAKAKYGFGEEDTPF